jgi:flagellin-like hook-associated protein FlgL
VDLVEAASRFQLEQTVLEAGLQAAARILNVSLLDFLG